MPKQESAGPGAGGGAKRKDNKNEEKKKEKMEKTEGGKKEKAEIKPEKTPSKKEIISTPTVILYDYTAYYNCFTKTIYTI